MFTVRAGAKHHQLMPDELDEYKQIKRDYYDKATERETKSIEDFIKHLWIVNGASASLSIGFIQSKGVFDSFQFYGACSFVLGLIVLLIFKFVHEIISSYDLHRFQTVIGEIENNRIPVDSLRNIRNKPFKIAKHFFLVARIFAAICFIVGLCMTLYAFRGYTYL